MSRLDLMPTEPFTQWTLGALSAGITVPNIEADQSFLTSVEAKNDWSYPFMMQYLNQHKDFTFIHLLCLAWKRVNIQNNKRQNRVLDIESIHITHRQNTMKLYLYRGLINTVP